jgi:site-specific DNA-methyltransferase (cytosine-N4-specific)
MKKLLADGRFNSGSRPSQHRISRRGFCKNNRGSIAQNVLEIEPIDPGSKPRLPNAFRFPNTQSNDFFMRQCREQGITPHPARMPAGLASFFIQFLTDPGDLVLDPFAGSNTTGFVAELTGRRWLAIDQDKEYVRQSRIRFQDPELRRRSKRRTSR